MNPKFQSREHAVLPPGLPIKKASFYWTGGAVTNIKLGTRGGYDYAVFDYDPNTETSPRRTVIALKMNSPTVPTTNLSSASGIRLERVGPWILAFEGDREISFANIEAFIDDVLKLLEYAKDFPKNP